MGEQHPVSGTESPLCVWQQFYTSAHSFSPSISLTRWDNDYALFSEEELEGYHLLTVIQLGRAGSGFEPVARMWTVRRQCDLGRRGPRENTARPATSLGGVVWDLPDGGSEGGTGLDRRPEADGSRPGQRTFLSALAQQKRSGLPRSAGPAA